MHRSSAMSRAFPIIIGIIVLLIALQLLLGRVHFWIPGWLLERSVKSDKLKKSIQWLLPPARFIDHLLKPRFSNLTQGAAIYIIEFVNMVIALAIPVIIFVPFCTNIAGAAFTGFGLSLIAREGLLALIAFIFTAGILRIITCNLI